MKIYHELDHFVQKEKCALTIGNYDALHLGHHSILEHMDGQKVVLTFSNHPSTILSSTPKQQVLTLPHKLHLLQKMGVHYTLLLSFTKELSEMSAEAFLKNLHNHIPFSSLHLGYDAKIGHRREGDQHVVTKIAEKLGFQVHYHTPLTLDSKPISTSQIRTLIQNGNLERVKALLGRSYSLFGTVIRGSGRGHTLGFKTMNLDVNGLCLPPLGVWAVDVNYQNTLFKGIANLGFAPTLRKTSCQLEVHLPGFEKDLYDQEIEVFLTHYIRPEREFLSVEDLKNQIKKDLFFIHP